MSNPLKWPGGKTYLAQRIIERFPPHINYVEPYFGGGAVLFAKPDEWINDHSEVVNDIDGELMNFWTVLRSPGWFTKFQRFVSMIPFSEQLWEQAYHYGGPDDADDKAWVQAGVFFIRYRQSRQALGKDFATLSKNRTRRGMNEQVSAWLSAVEGLPEAHERLKRVVILNRPALDVIRSEDSPNTFFYLDPPYLHETRESKDLYVHEMSVDDHCKLLTILRDIKGKFLLSGYPSNLYGKAASDYGWNRHDILIDNKASSKKVKDTKTECLWSNY